MRREKRRKERESQDNRALADAAAKRIQATIMAVVGDRSSWSVSTRDKWGDGEWTVHVSDNILLYRDFAANRAADIEAALGSATPTNIVEVLRAKHKQYEFEDNVGRTALRMERLTNATNPMSITFAHDHGLTAILTGEPLTEPLQLDEYDLDVFKERLDEIEHDQDAPSNVMKLVEWAREPGWIWQQ